MIEWIQANWVGITAIVFAVIRVIESVMVVMKNQKALSIIKVIKEFFKLS